MDKLLEKYMSDIRNALPFFRLSAFVLILFMSVASHDEVKLSFVRDMLTWRVEKFSFESKGLLGSAIGADLMIALIFTSIGCFIYWVMQRSFVGFLQNKLHIEKRKELARSRFSFLRELPADLKKDQIIWLRKRFDRNISRAKRWHSLGEFACVVAVALFLFSLYSGLEDAFIGGVLILSSMACIGFSVYLYLRHAIPFEIQLASLSATPLDDNLFML